MLSAPSDNMHDSKETLQQAFSSPYGCSKLEQSMLRCATGLPTSPSTRKVRLQKTDVSQGFGIEIECTVFHRIRRYSLRHSPQFFFLTNLATPFYSPTSLLPQALICADTQLWFCSIYLSSTESTKEPKISAPKRLNFIGSPKAEKSMLSRLPKLGHMHFIVSCLLDERVVSRLTPDAIENCPVNIWRKQLL